MQRFVHGFTFLLALVAATNGFAQQPSEFLNQSQADPRAIAATKDAALEQGLAALAPQTCFASGSGATFLKVCVTINGNVSWFESPAGVVHIRSREGYAVCSFDGYMTVHGFDANVAAEGWGPATVSDNARVITRTSLDGLVQLKQTFTIVPAARGVDVKMEVKNLSPLTLAEVFVSRYFDGDIDDQPVNQYSHTNESVWARKHRAFMITSAPTTNTIFPNVTTYSEWDPLGSGSQYARGCGGNLAISGATGDYVGGLVTRFYNVKAGQTKSVILRYRRF